MELRTGISLCLGALPGVEAHTVHVTEHNLPDAGEWPPLWVSQAVRDSLAKAVKSGHGHDVLRALLLQWHCAMALNMPCLCILSYRLSASNFTEDQIAFSQLLVTGYSTASPAYSGCTPCMHAAPPCAGDGSRLCAGRRCVAGGVAAPGGGAGGHPPPRQHAGGCQPHFWQNSGSAGRCGPAWCLTAGSRAACRLPGCGTAKM